MRNVQHILFPVDFSDRCRSVKPFVKAMAQRFGAKVTLMHVMKMPTALYAGFDVAYPVTLDLEAMRGDAEENLAAFYDVPHHPLPDDVELNVEMSDPASAIVAYADAHEADLIMMPTHGYGGFRGLLLGSTTAKVLHDTSGPVWTAAHSEDPSLPDEVRCEHVLCAIDLSEESVSLIRSSVEFAARWRARLTLVHAVAGAGGNIGPGPAHDFQHFLMDTARDQAARIQREAGTNLQVCIAAGDVSKVVRESALRHRADLVTIGRGKLHNTFGRLRTHAYSIIRDSPCPVLSI